MSRVTLKSSTIFISVGNKTEVYRSVSEVPPRLRKKLEQSTNGLNSATILIADRKGKEEIVRAIRGLPSSLRSQIGSSAPDETSELRKLANHWVTLSRYWFEMLLPPALGMAVWFLFTLK